MPEPETFTPVKRFRLAESSWRRLGQLVGPRRRSRELVQLVEWRIRHPHVDLQADVGERVVDFVVRIRLGDGTRKAEVVAMPGNAGGRVDELKTEIMDAIRTHFAGKSKEVLPR